MNDFIFNSKSIFVDKSNNETEIELFTTPDKADYTDNNNIARSKEDNNFIYAKKYTRKNGTIKYTVRMGNNSKFVNPFTIYDKEHENLFINNVCRSSDKFKEVSVKVFKLYIQFLNTKNIAYLNNAERENE